MPDTRVLSHTVSMILIFGLLMPLGFAIGSQTVPEIAISIVAELIAVRNLGATIPEARTRVKA